MISYNRAYLFKNSTVVLNKSHIMNATDDEFTEITLLISDKEIEDLHFTLQEGKETEVDEDD